MDGRFFVYFFVFWSHVVLLLVRAAVSETVTEHDCGVVIMSPY